MNKIKCTNWSNERCYWSNNCPDESEFVCETCEDFYPLDDDDDNMDDLYNYEVILRERAEGYQLLVDEMNPPEGGE